MDEVFRFFKGLFSVSEWPARWHCGYWSDFHGWLYILSDLAIWGAYFVIPLIILRYFSKKKTSIRFQAAYIYFALFILLCGATHFLDAMTFWIPMYRLNALVRFFTATVSLLTVYYLIKTLPRISEIKTTVELEREIHLRQEAEFQLAEANKGLEMFAAIASHDLQEPLRKMGMYASVLKDKNVGLLDAESVTLTDKITESAERLRALTQAVLTLSGLKPAVQMNEVDIAEVVRRAVGTLDLRITETGASIQLAIDAPPVMGNENYLIQLFTNLISNALKFTREKPLIRITGQVNGTEVWVAIKDNGIGIPEKDFDRIVMAFERLHSKSEFAGSGLGLAICKKIVDLHRGKLIITSEMDQGTTFTVRLPLFQALTV